MKKILLAILLVGITGSIFIINEANAAPGTGIKATIESVMATLIDHEDRITSIESKTSTVVANSQQPSLFSEAFFASVGEGECELLVTDSDPSHQYVRGWCPDSQYFQYIIEDARVTPDTLVIVNIQNDLTELEGTGTCLVMKTGDFPINATFTIDNGFLLDCSNGVALTPTHTLIYSVFN